MLRRTLALLITTVLLCALSVLAVYRVVSPFAFASERSDLLLAKARQIAAVVQAWNTYEITDEALSAYIGRTTSQWNAYVWVVNAKGETIRHTARDSGSGAAVGGLPDALQELAQDVLDGQVGVRIGRFHTYSSLDELYTAEGAQGVEAQPQGEEAASPIDGNAEEISVSYLPAEDAQDMVAVGLPVRRWGRVVGAVVLGQTMPEVTAGLSTLYKAVRFVLLAVVLLMLPVACLASARAARPIRQMRDAALRMARGDFRTRTFESERGEIGALGFALNHLAGGLEGTLASLSEERGRLSHILNGLSEGVVALDARGRVTHVNDALYAILDAQKGETDPRELIACDAVRKAFARVLGGQGVQEAQFHRGEKAIRVRVCPMATQADEGAGRAALRQAAGAVGVFSDITQAERLERTRRDYVANVSHELRTPLTALRGLIDPLRDGLVSDDAQRARLLDTMLQKTLYLTRLVGDMLELSRLQSGAVSAARGTFGVREALLSVCKAYEAPAEERNQTLRADLPDGLPRVRGDAQVAARVLRTLLSNACRYTPCGGHIRVYARLEGDRVVVHVADDGVGIAPGDLPHVFERFYKADKAHGGGGTGLGLAIAREALRVQGEQIFAASKPGEGSDFSFTLGLASEG